MAYIYQTNYPLNKSGTKNISVALNIHNKQPMVLLCKSLDTVLIHFTFEEYRKLTEYIDAMGVFLRRDAATQGPIIVNETLRIHVGDCLDKKAVIIERLNDKGDVLVNVFYQLATWNFMEYVQPCVYHVMQQYEEHA